ncbi:MAG TPA: hypothetical protein VIT19_11305 [Pyrinomonadaceae bacterium]
MKTFALSTLLLAGLLAPPQRAIKLEIGAKLDRQYIPKKIAEEIVTSSAQTRPFIKQSVGGVEYIIAFDAKTREIKYLHTTDENFRSKNGLRVGSEIALTRQQLIVIPSWEIRAPITSDGWYPVVGWDIVPLDFDLVGSFKGNETRMVSIDGFSKGGN